MRRSLEPVGGAALETDQDRWKRCIYAIERRDAQCGRQENRAARATICAEAASERALAGGAAGFAMTVRQTQFVMVVVADTVE